MIGYLDFIEDALPCVTYGLALTVLYAFLKPWINARCRWSHRRPCIIGIFALCAGTTVLCPIIKDIHYQLDLRNLYTCLAALYGGPLGAMLAVAAAGAALSWIGAPVKLISLTVMGGAIGIGLLGWFRQGRRSRRGEAHQYGPHHLLLAGFIVGALSLAHMAIGAPIDVNYGMIRTDWLLLLLYPLAMLVLGLTVTLSPERILFNQASRIANTLNTIAEAVVETNSGLFITYLSDRFETLFGGDARQIEGWHILDLFVSLEGNGQSASVTPGALAGWIEDKQEISDVQIGMRSGDGAPRSVRLSGRPYRDWFGFFAGYHFTIARDATDELSVELTKAIGARLEGKTGEAYLREMVLGLSAAVHADITYVSFRRAKNGGVGDHHLETLQIWMQGEMKPNLCLQLVKTPSALQAGHDVLVLPDLAPLGRDGWNITVYGVTMHSYAGILLYSQNGEAIGSLSCLWVKDEMPEPHLVELLMHFYAQRTAAQLEYLLIEAELSSSRQQMQTLLDNLPGLAYRVAMKPDGRYTQVFASRGGEVGSCKDTRCFVDCRSMDMDARSHFFRTVAADGTSAVIWSWKNCFEEDVWISETARLVQEQGRDFLIDGYLVDVTDEVRAQRRLVRSEAERMEVVAAIEMAQDLIALSMPEGVLYANAAMRRLFAIEQIGGGVLKPWDTIRTPDGRLCVDAEQRIAIRGELDRSGAFCGDIEVLNAVTGEPMQLALRVSLLPAGRAVIVGSDVTEKLRIARGHEHARQMETLGKLAGGIAHDFNNLLGVILGNANFIVQDLLKAGVPDPANHRHAQRIHAAATSARSLIAQILNFSRRKANTHQPVLLAELVTEVGQLLSASLPSRILLSTAGATDQSLQVDGDRTQLSQVLLNLCMNASDAIQGAGSTKAGLINITIGRELVTPAIQARLRLKANWGTPVQPLLWEDDLGCHYAAVGRWPAAPPTQDVVQIAVADNAQGIKALSLPRIFEPFYSTRGNGTGLGLAIVADVVERHGGAVVVESRPGMGSRFILILPEGQMASLSPPVEPTALEADVNLSGRILVVDDNTEFADMLSTMLERRGAEVAVVMDGEKAYQVARREKWDLVVTDHAMPGCTGLDLIWQIKVLRPQLPCILVSGGDMPDIATVQEAGVDYQLSKPIDEAVFLRVVADLLKRRSHGGGATPAAGG